MDAAQFERELADTLPSIRTLVDASRVVGRSPGLGALQALARTLEIEIVLDDDVFDQEFSFGLALGDVIESRIQSLIWTLGQMTGTGFDYACAQVNRALGF